MKKLLYIPLFTLFLISWKSSSQIVTSKKEAEKKGMYSYSEKPSDDNLSTASFYGGGSSNTVASIDPPAKKKKEKKSASATKANPKDNYKYLVTADDDADYSTECSDNNYLALQIVNNAMEFEGVRYRGGGTTKDGMDCSGMVFTTFKIFDITLPRSSGEMAKVGESIELKNVKKGDLLFFNNNRRRNTINHVGLVIENENGDVKFIHSTLSGGVMVSSMSEAYYTRTYVSAKRMI